MGKSYRSNDEYSRKYANKRRNIGGTKKKQNKNRQYESDDNGNWRPEVE